MGEFQSAAILATISSRDKLGKRGIYVQRVGICVFSDGHAQVVLLVAVASVRICPCRRFVGRDDLLLVSCLFQLVDKISVAETWRDRRIQESRAAVFGTGAWR